VAATGGVLHRRFPGPEEHGSGIRTTSPRFHVREIKPQRRDAAGRQTLRHARHEGVLHARARAMGDHRDGDRPGCLGPQAGDRASVNLKRARFRSTRSFGTGIGHGSSPADRVSYRVLLEVFDPAVVVFLLVIVRAEKVAGPVALRTPRAQPV